jgi:hypothetical protein
MPYKKQRHPRNAPSTFQSLMNHVFHPFLRHFVLVFFDDILIYRKTWTDHLAHVDRVLHLLSQHQLFLKQSKCSFGASEVEYLGHLVGKDDIRVDPKKIEAMQDWPHPKTLKILHGFLGLTGYYRKFVKNYGKIAAPLTALLKKNSFTWTPAAAQDFQTLKMAMCTTPVLALPDFTNTFVLECDASGKGIGVVLMQEGRSLAFTSKQLSERNLENQSMKRKCWLFCMSLICGALIYWGNASKLRQTIKASSIFWNNAFPPRSNKNG